MNTARIHTILPLCLGAALSWVACSDNGGVATYSPDGGTGGSAPTGKGVGESCTGDAECRPGLACTADTCQPAHSSAEGDACVISAECLQDLYCAGGVCAPAGSGGEGDACVTDGDCTSGLRCVLEGLSATCQPEGAVDLGGSCTASSDCFGGLACVDGACAQLPPGVPPFGMPWGGVDCPDESGSVKAYFHVPRGDSSDADFFRLPFPNDVRLSGSTLDLSGFPTPGDALLGFDIVQRYIDALVATHDGWGMYSGVFFRFSGQLDTDSFKDNVILVDLTADQQLGLFWAYTTGRSQYICNNRIFISRSQGRVFEPGHSYAAVFLTGITDANGAAVERPGDLVALLSDTAPSDPALSPHWPKYQPLRQYLTDHTIDPATVLTASVFTIGHPRKLIEQLQSVIDGLGPATATSWTSCDTGVTSPCPDATGDRACPAANADYYELHALVELPIFQQGNAPYFDPADGGAIKQSSGVPAVDHTEQVCMALSVPKGAAPPGGWPTVVFAHGTGGSFRSHLKSGLATDFAQGVGDGQGGTVRAAVLGIDQVQHGPRRGGSTKSPSDLFFNFANPDAARGNPQQGAADQMALLRFVPTVSFDQSSSPTGEAFSLSSTVAFWGHSQGATEGAIATPYGDWAGVLFSGQGAALRDSLVTKTSPVDIAGLIGFVLSDFDSKGQLRHGARHPVLNLMQHYIDGADPIAYGRLLAAAPPGSMNPRSVFQPYGINDTYTPSKVQANYALSASLALVEPDASVSAPEDISNLTPTAPPLSGNLTVNSVTVTAAVREYQQMSTDDGHFVVFDVAAARGDAERFLAGALGAITPIVGQ